MVADAAPVIDASNDEWNAVRLTEARQVAALMGYHADDWPPPEVAVRTRYEELRADAGAAAAVKYLAHALPRLEAVAWAARLLESHARQTVLSPSAHHALNVSLRWLGERSDAHRRAAREAAEAIGKPAAERALGLAIYYSGGSIAAQHQPPLMPPDHVAARYVVSAISQAAYRTEDAEAVFARALSLGEAIARGGLDALRTREGR